MIFIAISYNLQACEFMRSRYFSRWSTFLLIYLLGNLAPAQTTITVTSNGLAKPARSNFISYGAICQDVGYEIRILKDSAQMLFIVKDGGGEHAFDISETRFGRDVLHKRLLGNYGFSCARQSLGLLFMGIELAGSGQSEPVSYNIALGNDGAVLLDGGRKEESIDTVNRFLPNLR